MLYVCLDRRADLALTWSRKARRRARTGSSRTLATGRAISSSREGEEGRGWGRAASVGVELGGRGRQRARVRGAGGGGGRATAADRLAGGGSRARACRLGGLPGRHGRRMGMGSPAWTPSRSTAGPVVVSVGLDQGRASFRRAGRPGAIAARDGDSGPAHRPRLPDMARRTGARKSALVARCMRWDARGERTRTVGSWARRRWRGGEGGGGGRSTAQRCAGTSSRSATSAGDNSPIHALFLEVRAVVEEGVLVAEGRPSCKMWVRGEKEGGSQGLVEGGG